MTKSLTRKILLCTTDIAFITLSVFLSFYLLGIRLVKSMNLFYIFFPIAEAILIVFLFIVLGLYKSILKYTSVIDLIKIIIAVMVNFVAVGTFSILTNQEIIGLRYVTILSMFLLLFLSFVRFTTRLFVQIKNNELFTMKEKQNNVMIVGAGDAGTTILRELLNTDKIERNPVCFIDDDPKKTNTTIMGVPVVGVKETIPENAIKYNVKEIIVSVPSLPKQSNKFS